MTFIRIPNLFFLYNDKIQDWEVGSHISHLGYYATLSQTYHWNGPRIFTRFRAYLVFFLFYLQCRLKCVAYEKQNKKRLIQLVQVSGKSRRETDKHFLPISSVGSNLHESLEIFFLNIEKEKKFKCFHPVSCKFDKGKEKINPKRNLQIELSASL